MRVPLTLACGAYDRTAALARGEIRPEGVDLTFLALPVEETFFRMTRHREFDAAEMSLSSYLISLDEDAPFVAIPAFVSRAFRHNGIYVGAASRVTDPAGLAGGLVGVAEYQLTANVWIRGILAERHGLPVTSVRYRTGGLHEPGRVAKLAHDPPPGVEIEPIPAGATLAGMLADGQLDALYTPRVPHGFGEGRVRRLFADARRGGGAVLRGDRRLPGHARGGAQARRLRAAALAGPVPVQGVRAGPAGGGGAAGGDGGGRLAAALGVRRGGADPGRDGGGLLDLRPGRERGDAGHVRPVLLRAGADQAGSVGRPNCSRPRPARST